jgi:hypothetical protein
MIENRELSPRRIEAADGNGSRDISSLEGCGQKIAVDCPVDRCTPCERVDSAVAVMVRIVT